MLDYIRISLLMDEQIDIWLSDCSSDMPSLDPDSIYPATHTLMEEDYHEAMKSLAHIALRYGTDVYVLCEGAWLDEDLPDTEECRRVFQQIRETYERLRKPERIRDGDAVEYHGRLPEASDIIKRVLSAGPGICWDHFVSELIVAVDDQCIFFARPHHSTALVSVSFGDGESYLAAANNVLEQQTGCLVQDGVRIEWEMNDDEWSIRSNSLCVGVEQSGRSSACWGLSGIDDVSIDDDETMVTLSWYNHRPDNRVEQVLQGVSDRLFPDAPIRLQFEDRATAQAVAELIVDTLVRFRGHVSVEPPVDQQGNS